MSCKERREQSEWSCLGDVLTSEKVKDMTMGWASEVGERSRSSLEVRSLQN